MKLTQNSLQTHELHIYHLPRTQVTLTQTPRHRNEPDRINQDLH